MKYFVSEHLGAAAGAGESLWGLCRAWVLPRTAGVGEGEVHCGEMQVSEQIGVGAGAGEFENEHAFLDLVDEQPVGGDVTFAMIRPVAGERVVAVGGRQRFASGQFADDVVEFRNVKLAADGELVVPLELTRPVNGVLLSGRGIYFLVHGHRLSSARASERVCRLRVGSLTMRSPSSIAAMVSALGMCGASMMKGIRRSRTMVLMYTLMTEEAESPTSSQKSVNCFLVGASSEKVMFAIVISPLVDSDSRVLYTKFTGVDKWAA